MTKQEFATFAMALRTYYPNEKLIPNDKAMELWFFQLKDIPYNIAEVTLNKWVACNKWSPKIADIREQAQEVLHGEAKSWSEAWQDVLNAISRYGVYDADKGIEMLDGVTLQVVKRLGYTNLCMTENISIERANFRDIYEQEIAKKKQDAQIPPQIQGLIQTALRGDAQEAIGTEQEEEEA